MNDTETAVDAQEVAGGLRRLADMVEDHPDTAEHVEYAVGRLLVPLTQVEELLPALALWRHAGMAAGADVALDAPGEPDAYRGYTVSFGPVRLYVYAQAYRVDVALADEPETLRYAEALRAVSA